MQHKIKNKKLQNAIFWTVLLIAYYDAVNFYLPSTLTNKYLYLCSPIPYMLTETIVQILSKFQNSRIYDLKRLDYAGNLKIQKIILASAAIPLFYQPRSITNRLYIDGGWSDNIPAKPLIEAGFSNIIVVHLDRESRKEHEIWKKSISGIESNKTKFYHIYPPKDFDDSILAIAKINPILTKSRMEAGYKAASKFINLS